jgi:HEAT repeat protein
MATPQDLLSALSRAYFLTETGFSENPEYGEAIQEVREIQGEVGWFLVRVQDEDLTAGGEPVTIVSEEFAEFRAALHEAGIQELRFQEVLEPQVLEDFLRRLHPSSATEGTLPSARFRGLEGDLGLSFRESPATLPGQATLPGMVGGVQDLFHTSPPSFQLPSEGAFQSGSVSPEPADGLSSPDSVLPPELAEEVRTYIDSQDLVRAESETKLRARAEELTKSRNLAALSGLVQLLVESAGDGPQAQEVIELVGELTTPAVASHIVARLGSTRDEAERSRLVHLTSRVGREGALALADALEEARDRFQRRAFLDAMVALGPMALEMAQRMVRDPRWFVVRNGVTVLGELGGEEAVTHLTATLANADSRVRRETVLSLAKVGGLDAEMLLLGMLNDGKPDVRAAACRGLGVLKSDRALRSLLGCLKDGDPDVQVECLRALGQIGDPGAVRLVEKRALGGLFSRRPQREIRIAAFRALAGIGTPQALRTLEKGAKDRDQGVRTIVKALIGEG